MAKKDNNYYFDSFSRGISFANDAAALLYDSFENYEKLSLSERLLEMHNIEHTADTVKHSMMERLVKEFLPPIEREDIVELAHVIDNVTDAIEEILRRMYMYNIKTLRSDVKDFAELIIRSCAVLADITAELHNFRRSEKLASLHIEVNRLEGEGDVLYTEAVRRLFAEEKDPITILAWSTIYDRLEKCCDACESVADVIEQIVLKNS